jgi:hypothetical protein
MAKSGLLGFGQTLAQEGQKDNIHTNVVAPVASSRILASVNPTDLLKPSYVSPLLLYLCHPNTKENGGIFECGGGYFAKLKWFRSEGISLDPKKEITMEDISKEFNKITNFSKGEIISNSKESWKPIMKQLSKL